MAAAGRRPAGRARRRGVGARDLVLTLRVSEREREAVRRIAARRNVTVAQVLREAFMGLLLDGYRERNGERIRLVKGGGDVRG